MALNSIAKEWDRFAAMIFKGFNPSETQRAEMKKAFYAGAFTIVSAMKQIDEGIPDAEAVAYFESVAQEGEAFYRELIREYAAKN